MHCSPLQVTQHSCVEQLLIVCYSFETTTAAGLQVLEKATLSCVTTANIAVFRPQTPGTEDGPRVWNNQLIR
jgi:hypothetical protein